MTEFINEDGTQAELFETSREKFQRLLHKYVTFRGIDIVLHLKDGEVVELDKNRYIDGEYVIKRDGRQQIDRVIPIREIQRAEFFAA